MHTHAPARSCMWLARVAALLLLYVCARVRLYGSDSVLFFSRAKAGRSKGQCEGAARERPYRMLDRALRDCHVRNRLFASRLQKSVTIALSDDEDDTPILSTIRGGTSRTPKPSIRCRTSPIHPHVVFPSFMQSGWQAVRVWLHRRR